MNIQVLSNYHLSCCNDHKGKVYGVLYLFQLRTPDDYKITWQRVALPNGNNPYEVMKNEIMQTGPPNVLFIGASHISRLEKFSKSRATPYKYQHLLSKSMFMGIGGTKWHCLRDNLNGILPPNKTHLGNLWAQYHS